MGKPFTADEEKKIQDAVAAHEDEKRKKALDDEIRNRILDDQRTKPGYKYY